MGIIPSVSSAEAGWALAGLGAVTGTILVSKLPAVIGTYTSLVAGVVLIAVAMKFIKNHEIAAFAFGVGFAWVLDGVIRRVMPQTATTQASYLNITL